MTKYQGYDVTDATHKTSIHNDWKVVVAKKKPARGVTLTIGIFSMVPETIGRIQHLV
ncbi:hypothetical protein OkiPb00875_30370 [Escherichia coli]